MEYIFEIILIQIW